MIYYWMTCGKSTPVIVGIDGNLVWQFGKVDAKIRTQFKNCTFERVPDHHPAFIEYPAILETRVL